MPPLREGPRIETRLSSNEYERFLRLVGVRELSQAQLARDAICFYIDWLEKGDNAARENELERRIKKSEDRIASLLARANIDIGVLIGILYSNMPLETREADLKMAHTKSVERLKRKIQSADDLKELYKTPEAGQ